MTAVGMSVPVNSPEKPNSFRIFLPRTLYRWSVSPDSPQTYEPMRFTPQFLEELKARRNEAQSAVVDVDESESAENFELPGADLSGEELSVRVIPKQADEFTCSSCFLVHHRSRLASEKNGVMICTDCAA